MAQQVQVEGLSELIAAFKIMPKEVDEEITWELEEAAQPVRMKSTNFILSGGGGSPAMRNMPPTPVYAAMKINVTRAERAVNVLPAWRGHRVGSGRPNVAGEFQKRMNAALEEERDNVGRKLEVMIDVITERHGF